MTQGYNFIKKVTSTQVFSCEFCEIFKNTFFHRIPPVAAYADAHIESNALLRYE